MIAPTNIHPPKNWQDFETLCLKLWGEIWQIPHEIEFNSDNAQGQHGVDIYGPIDGGISFNGVQCKNKKLNLIDGSPNRITISDIDAEIKKALNFKPALKKLVIATSLPKDQKIEEHVRIKSAEHARQNLFTIQICFWEFFERKLPEFPKVNDWYLKHEDFQRPASMEISFSDGGKTKAFHPKYQKTITRYTTERPPEIKLPENLAMLSRTGISIEQFMESARQRQEKHDKTMELLYPKIEWQQNCWMKLFIQNTGQRVIEDFKVRLDFSGDFIEVGAERRSGLANQHFRNNVKEYSNSNNSLYIQPTEKTLVQKDSFTSGSFYIKPFWDRACEVRLKWKLLARDFEDTGELLIKIEPKYFVVENKVYVISAEEERVTTEIGLIKRAGSYNVFHGTSRYTDRESDYTFE